MFAENTIFIVFAAQHSNYRKKTCILKTEKLNSGLFFSMAKRCFCLGVLLHFWFMVAGWLFC